MIRISDILTFWQERLEKSGNTAIVAENGHSTTYMFYINACDQLKSMNKGMLRKNRRIKSLESELRNLRVLLNVNPPAKSESGDGKEAP